MPPSRTPNGPQENLTGVMGRFQAWTQTQPAETAASPAEGVREVTYAEALAAQRLRRPLRAGKPEHIAQGVSLDATHELSALLSPRKPLLAAMEVVALPSSSPVMAEAGIPAPAAKSSAARTQQAAPSKAPRTRRTVPAPAPLAMKAAAPSVTRRTPKTVLQQKGTTVHAPRKTAAPAPVPASTRSRTATPRIAVAASSPLPGRTSIAVSPKTTQSDFKAEFLKNLKNTAGTTPASPGNTRTFETRPAAAGKAPTVKPAKPVNGKSVIAAFKAQPAQEIPAASSTQKSAPVLRSISINLRLSNAEHSQLRSRAAAANQPMAVYVRDCALRTPAAASKKTHEAMAEDQITLSHPDRILEPTMVAPRSLSEVATDFLERVRTFWLGSRIEVTA